MLVSSPQCDAVVRCPTTGKEYRIIDAADRLNPGKFKSPTNCKAGTRLWALCGFELDDTIILKTTDMLRKFTLIESGTRPNAHTM